VISFKTNKLFILGFFYPLFSFGDFIRLKNDFCNVNRKLDFVESKPTHHARTHENLKKIYKKIEEILVLEEERKETQSLLEETGTKLLNLEKALEELSLKYSPYFLEEEAFNKESQATLLAFAQLKAKFEENNPSYLKSDFFKKKLKEIEIKAQELIDKRDHLLPQEKQILLHLNEFNVKQQELKNEILSLLTKRERIKLEHSLIRGEVCRLSRFLY
jgi:chromosome segregation ATPase